MSNSSSARADMSIGSNISASVNNNNNSLISNSNCNGEQPQTKRQKLEKLKMNVKAVKITKTNSSLAASTATVSLPPDIIDTGGVTSLDEHNQQQLRCSSLSSSANSISAPSSINNSPTSTPSGSRATSLSHLLNDHVTTTRILPGNVLVPDQTDRENRETKLKCPTQNNSKKTATCSSIDEVDRTESKSDFLSVELNTSENIQLTPQPTKYRENLADAGISPASSHSQDMHEFEASLNKQCLCGVSEQTLRKPFQSHYSIDSKGQKRIANLSEWPTEKLLQFLSNLQLLFDIYLKQNSKGFICARIMDLCDVLIRNDHNLIDEIIVLADYNNEYVQFLAARVLASFLIIAKQELNDSWLKTLVENLFNFERLDEVAVQKIHFSLEIIKRIVEWKDIDLHPLEDEIVAIQGGGNSSANDRDRNTAQSSASAIEENDTFSSERFLHFPPQQQTLATNYFALQFRSSPNSVFNHEEDEEGDEIEDDYDDDVLEESMVQAHTRRHNSVSQIEIPHQHHQLQLPQNRHFSTYNIHDNSIPNNTNYLPANLTYQSTTTAHISNSHYVNDHTHPYTQQQHIHQNIMGEYHTHVASFNSQPISNTLNVTQQTSHSTPLPTNILPSGCHIITLTDSESFDTSHLKGVTIKILENKWPVLVKNMSALIMNHMHIDHAEHCILNFLQLWENIISVKANLSVVETRPFYAQLDKFELLLQQQQLSCTVYKQLLCLFNEALCYGSTLALQDMLPVETCRLAQRIVRHIKEARILDSLPRRQPENIVSFLGFKRPAVLCTGGNSSQSSSSKQRPSLTHTENELQNDVIEMDKTILQKMVLLVLKSVAVTVKEIRSDSSDSSIDSQDCDAYQDMVLIERSIRDVLRKLESFIKHKLEFHPECHFSKILIHLFDDQDDHLIEAMVCTLDVTAGISFRNNAFPELVSMLNPIYTFLEFLKMISNSSDLLLDLLVSNETCFLLYLLRFLKYIRANWEMFLRSCHDFGMGAPVLDEAMSVLIRLRLHISRLVARQLYPYDISPVLRLLESCEGLYEGNDRSLT